MTRDCNLKRAKFISITHSLNQEFHFSEPTMVVNSIPAGVLENQNMLGVGVNLTPPLSLNPMFDVQI